MIYTLTLNPSLDYLVDVPSLQIGQTNRSLTDSLHFGGKGINVSYVLKQLGVASVCFGFAGGFTGVKLLDMLEEDGLKCDFVTTRAGNTRINVKIKSGEITEINANGPCITNDEINQLIQKLDKLTSEDTLVLAGSTPAGHDGIYNLIMQHLSTKGVKFVVDTSGKKLLDCLKFKPLLVKPNLSELSEILGEQLVGEEQIICGAQKLLYLGSQNVIVSMGEKGAILVAEDGEVYKAVPIKITPQSTVGAGDSMLAGFLAGYDRGCEYALKLGNACGAATASCTVLAKREDIYAMM